jgi:hypothetical protein
MLPIGGLFTGRLKIEELPPPGDEFTAVSDNVPEAERSEAVRVALASVALTKAVGLAEPLTLITVVGTKPVPVTVTACTDAPSNSTAGELDAITGDGLSTSRLIGVPAAVLTVPLSTVTASCAPLASCVVGTVAVSWVLLTYVVASAAPPN